MRVLGGPIFRKRTYQVGWSRRTVVDLRRSLY